MAQPFAFPPPPPPPPRNELLPLQASPAYARSYNGNVNRDYRGNAYSRGRGRGDGLRGFGFTQGGRGSRGSYGTRNFNQNSNDPRQSPTNSQYISQHAQDFQHGFPASNLGQKRPYSSAFYQQVTSLPRPQAPPAVPSFGGDLLPPAPPPAASRLGAQAMAQRKPRKRNQLGLTPTSYEQESSSEEDEEAQFANAHATAIASGAASTSSLPQVEYKGRMTTLQTAADIAAWISERKKNFPTPAKIKVAKKEAAEKRKKWADDKREKAEAQRSQKLEMDRLRQDELRKKALESVASKKNRQEEDSQDISQKHQEKAAEITKVTRRAEKLKRRLEKAQRDARKAEEALARLQQVDLASDKDPPEISNPSLSLLAQAPGVEALATPPAEPDHQLPQAPDDLPKLQAELLLDDENDTLSSTSTDSSDMPLSHQDPDSTMDAQSATTSSSDDTDSHEDSDSAPEELTTKPTSPDPIPPPHRNQLHPPSPSQALPIDRDPRPRNPCRNLLRTGHCQFGTRCRYSHDLSREQRATSHNGTEMVGRARERKTAAPRREAQQQSARKGLYQVLVEQELLEENTDVWRVIMEMGGRGMLAAEAAAEEDEDEDEPQEISIKAQNMNDNDDKRVS